MTGDHVNISNVDLMLRMVELIIYSYHNIHSKSFYYYTYTKYIIV